MSIPYFLSPALNKLPHVKHGFFTRLGGVSGDIFQSLNTGRFKGDDDANVLENRRRIAATFGQDLHNPVILTQKHTDQVFMVHGPFEGQPPEGDALITTTPNLILGVQTADCVPILLADSEKNIVGAVHAGWKGALSGIVENTVLRMIELGATPQTLVAAIGPCIWQDSYEVDTAYKAQFSKSEHLFKPGKPGHYYFDLPAYVVEKLNGLGVNQITASLANTCVQEHLFFSNRRAYLRRQGSFGVQLSVIGIFSS
jgi:YfiH family protein